MIIIRQIRIINGTNSSLKTKIKVKDKEDLTILKDMFKLKYNADLILLTYEEVT